MRLIEKDDFVKLLAIEKLNGKITIRDIRKTLGVSKEFAALYKTLLNSRDELKQIFGDNEIVGSNVKLEKQNLRLKDLNRIERKSFRDYSRMENALIALNEEVVSKFETINFNIKKVVSDSTKIVEGDQAIIQLTDAHFNELVDLDNNRYDFEVASERMMLLAQEAKRFLSAYGVKKVVLAMTGDMINSDRRLDEKLSMSTNRMTAAMLATNLIQYFIVDLMEEFEAMDVVYVTGNESRSFEFGFTDLVVTDNYDSIVFNMLRLVFRGVSNVNFIEGNPVESVICVNGKNILLLHGTTLGKDTQQNVQKIVGKFAAKGIIVDYAIFGHIHFANVTDLYARSGSLVGSNTYSDYGLGLVTKASQLVHLIRKDGTINNYRIELQNTDGIKGYPIQKDLEAYNAKSASKAYRQYKVIEIEHSAAR